MKAEKMYVLVVSSNSETINQLQRIFALERDYYIQFTNECSEALQIAGQENQDIDLILVDDAVSDAAALETIRKLAILLPAVPIIAIAEQTAVSYVREALLAGARAFITKPLHDSDVLNTVNQLLQMESARRNRQSQQHGGSNKRCAVLTVMSPKGGVGTTTIAINVAVALREATGGEVILVDGHGSLGDLVTAMNLQTQFSHGDLTDQGGPIDVDMVAGVLTTHSSGVQVMASSEDLEDGDYFTADVFEQVITLLKTMADYIVIDAGSIFESQTSMALMHADQLLLITTPEITALRRCALFLKAAEKEDFPRERIRLVVNREGVPGGLGADDISQNLNIQISLAVPDDPGFATYSLNRGIPLVTGNPRSAVARRISKFVEKLVPEDQGEAEGASKNLFGRLSTMLRSTPA